VSWSSSNNSTKDRTPPEFRKLRGEVAGRLSAAAGGAGPATSAFEGPLVADLTGGEQAGIDRITGLVGGAEAGGAQSQEFLQGLVGGQQLDFYNDPAFQQMLEFSGKRFLGAFNEREEAQKALFARAGHELPNSSPFAEARSRISDAKSSGLADLEAQLIGQEFGAARDRQANAVTQLSNLETARLDRARESLEAEGLPRLIRDMGIERGREEFGRRQAAIMQALGLELEAASPHLGGEGSSSSVSIL
jgi:hypothetical protein